MQEKSAFSAREEGPPPPAPRPGDVSAPPPPEKPVVTDGEVPL